jgi:hypothetical protein
MEGGLGLFFLFFEATFSPSTPLLLSALLAVPYTVYRSWLSSPYPSAAFGSPLRFSFSILIFPLSFGLHFFWAFMPEGTHLFRSLGQLPFESRPYPA